jgi:hypothetical protein
VEKRTVEKGENALDGVKKRTVKLSLELLTV